MSTSKVPAGGPWLSYPRAISPSQSPSKLSSRRQTAMIGTSTNLQTSSAACSTFPMINPLDINSSEPGNVARSSPNSPSFENRVTEVTDIADFAMEDRHPPIRKRKRVNSPANEPGLKQSRFHFVDACHGDQTPYLGGAGRPGSNSRVHIAQNHSDSSQSDKLLRNNAESATARRKAAVEVRQNSACIRCRMLKKRCDGDLPCDSCISRENSKCLWAQPCVRAAFSDLDLFGIGYEVIFKTPLPDDLLDETDESAMSSEFLKKKFTDELDLTLQSPLDPANLFRIDWKDIERLTCLPYLPANSLLHLFRQFRDVTGLPLAGLGIELTRSTVLVHHYTFNISRLRNSCAGRHVEPVEEVAQLLGAAARIRHGRKMMDILQRKVEDFRSRHLSLSEGMTLARCLIIVLEIVFAMGEDFDGIISFRSCFHVKKMLPQNNAAESQLKRILSGWFSVLNQRLVPALQERWKKVQELRVQIMEKSRGVLGEEHPNTLLSTNGLALTFICQRRWKEAEELLVPAMETSRKVLGKEHPITLIIMSNQAVTYYCQEQWKEAEELFVHVMETRRKVLGEEHPDTVMSMNNLATMFMHQFRWKEAMAVEGGRRTTRTSYGDEEKGTGRGEFGLSSGTGVILVPPKLEGSQAMFMAPAIRLDNGAIVTRLARSSLRAWGN